MAMIKCPECGKEVSDKASTCPSCGCPVNGQKKGVDPKIIIAVVAVAIIAVIVILVIPKGNNSNVETKTVTNEVVEEPQVKSETMDMLFDLSSYIGKAEDDVIDEIKQKYNAEIKPLEMWYTVTSDFVSLKNVYFIIDSNKEGKIVGIDGYYSCTDNDDMAQKNELFCTILKNKYGEPIENTKDENYEQIKWDNGELEIISMPMYTKKEIKITARIPFDKR